MKRRNFLYSTALATTAFAMSCSPKGMGAMNKGKKRVGLQLYSLRNEFSKDAIGTLEAVSRVGYDDIEWYGYNDGKFFGWTPQEFKMKLDDLNLRPISGHQMVTSNSWSAANGLDDNFKSAVEASNILGQKHLVCPYMANPDRTEENIGKLCKALSEAGQYCKDNGLQFGYHNHNFEFEMAGSKSIYDHILTETDADLVKMQMDIYWIVFAGKDPVELISNNKGRFMSYHCKDLASTEKRETCEVGEGTIDFADLFNKTDAFSGVEHYIVELEHYKRPAVEGVEISLNNLKNILG